MRGGAFDYATAALASLAVRSRRPVREVDELVASSPVRRFRCEVVVPSEYAWLEFDGTSEALVLLDGEPWCGVNPFHTLVPLPGPVGRRVEVSVERVPTGLMGRRSGDGSLGEVFLLEVDPVAIRVLWDLEVAREWIGRMTPGRQRRWGAALRRALAPLLAQAPLAGAVEALAWRVDAPAEEEGLRQALAAGTVEGLLVLDDAARGALVATLAVGLGELLARLSGEPGFAPGSPILALGHAHIDLAWLWPMAETRRKLVRTMASQVRLLEQHPSLRVVLSTAQYWRWLVEDAPSLATAIRGFIAEGRILAHTALWVESDAELVGAPTLLANLALGVRTTLEELGGTRPRVAFLPDTFGFAGGVPSLLAEAGIELLVTTKLVWNDTTEFPFAEAHWVGPDGRGVGLVVAGRNERGYNAPLTLADLERAVVGHEVHGGLGPVWYLFGHGDGGGGPDAGMAERLVRYRALLGPGRFVEKAELPGPWAPTVAGELYLERHRATPTKRTRTKERYGAAERLRLCADVWGCEESSLDAWEPIVRSSFHDVLPGSGIAEVEQDALGELEAACGRAEETLRRAVSAVFGAGEGVAVVNTARAPLPPSRVMLAGGARLEVPPLAPFEAVVLERAAARPVAHEPACCGTVPARRELGELEVALGARLEELLWGGRALLAAPAGLVAYRQHPADFDAWELVAPEERTPLDIEVIECRVEEASAARLAVVATLAVGASTITQRLWVDAALGPVVVVEGHARLREPRVVLAFELPTALEAPVVWRRGLWGTDPLATRGRTPADAARYEWVAHGAVRLAEGDLGVTLAAGSRYGFSAQGRCLGVTLAATSLYPDPDADREVDWRLAVVVGEGPWWEANLEGWAAWCAGAAWVLEGMGAPGSRHRPVVLDDAVEVLWWERRASTELLVVLGERRGRGRLVRLRLGRSLARAWRASFPEGEALAPLEVDAQGELALWLGACEVATLRLELV